MPLTLRTCYPRTASCKPLRISTKRSGFANYTVNAAGNNDRLLIYGDSGNQNYTATATRATMPVDTHNLIGNHFQSVYAYGMGGSDTASYSGSAANETMTALWNYTYVNTATTTHYFDRFRQLTVAGNGGLDVAVMYDSPGNDTFNASDMSFSFSRVGVFNTTANGYDKAYAFQYFGGNDAATLNGSPGNDQLTTFATYAVLRTSKTWQQATGFTTVIVNAGEGNDSATLQDGSGNDTLNARAGSWPNCFMPQDIRCKQLASILVAWAQKGVSIGGS